MTRPSLLRHPASLLLLGLLVLAPLLRAADRTFVSSPTLKEEAITLIKILEQAHYNRDAVRSADYANVVPDYMEGLDGQHLFFLGSDKTAFVEKYGRSVYYNTAFLGNVDAAYTIFARYQERVEARVTWIFKELARDFDLAAKETYRADRTKSEWPSTAADSDELWRRRLKFEVVAEMLNKKTAEQAKEAVHKRYERMLKNLADIEGHDLAELFLGTIARLYDPHSTYFSAETFEDFGIQMKLQLFGIGAILGLEDDYCVVKEVVVGGPADLSNQLKPNDKIISVAQTGSESVEILGMKLRKIVNMIRGERGTQVHLVVQPANATDPSARKNVTITRDLVKLNSKRAFGGVFQVPDTEGKNQSIGVITLPAFYSSDDGDTDTEKTSASKDVARLIEKLKRENIQGLVLDLRHNGGGYLSEAIELAGLFIHKGPVVQVKNYNGEIHVDSDANDKIAYAGPLAVLVDRFSASASEIVTGALQNYGRAIVIGDSSTHGKGSVQQVVEMKQVSGNLRYSSAKAGAAKFTIQKYYLPNGDSTQRKGVVPDIVLPSIDDFISGIGEADLPHALVWDKIPTSFFDGAPLEAKILTPLRQASVERQGKLEEFAYLKKNIDWFKARQDQKLISINLEDRKKQKGDDDAFRKTMKAEKDRIAKGDFTYTEVRLVPKPPPKPKAPKKETEKTEADDEEDADLAADDENDTYARADVHLRETLRVVSDAIALGHNKALWASNRAPLTASSGG
ncbi:MAG: carboxy terminal-processing peptidase [Verrucomicrobia bacterium]|nr:carboxy terminal-processing peptidase [Verrucomicrobiota bacterium]